MNQALEPDLVPKAPPESGPSLPGWGAGPAASEEARFLQGPQPRGFELGKALRIFCELMRGFRALHFVGPCVTVFGSARFPEGHPHYRLAREIGARLARAGFTVMTGGGPGIMEAANRRAKEAGGTRSAATSSCPRNSAPTGTSTAGSRSAISWSAS
jgi:SLOG cluster4 family